MRILKKIFVLFLVFTFGFQLNSDVFAQKRTSKKASTKRAAKSNKRSASSKSNKRSAGNTRRSVRSQRAAATGRSGTAGSSSSSSSSDSENSCYNAYATCMDLQINGFISKYSYLSDDPAIEAINETGDPLRCVYYHDLDNPTTVPDGNINKLYYAYNYYCSPQKTTGPSGEPLMGCVYDVDAGDVFATKGSYAFYKEAWDRLEAGELKIINFEKTELYAKKLKDYDMAMYDAGKFNITQSETDELLAGLGLKPETENGEATDDVPLFSVNVAPPTGAGSFDPAGMFQKAHEICTGRANVPTAKTSGMSATEISELQKERNKVRGATCSAQEEAMKAYYMTGVAEDGSESSFLSAQKSCKNYESALISSRSQIYAKFLDSMTNYLDANVAKLLQREAKDSAIIANSFNTLRQQDLDNQLSVLETETEMAQAKAQAQINQAKATQELKKSYDEITKSYKSQLQEFCSSKTASITLENFSQETNNAYVCFDPANISNNILDSINDPKDASKKACKNPSHILLDCFGSAVGLNKNDVIMNIVSKSNVDWPEKWTDAKTSDKLAAGLYKVEVAGGGGAGGTGKKKWSSSDAGDGGKGDKQVQIFYLGVASPYTAKIGAGGKSAGDGNGKTGGNGEASTFKIEGVIDITAEGGKGGTASSNGASSGNGEGASGGSGGEYCTPCKKRPGDDGKKGWVKYQRATNVNI